MEMPEFAALVERSPAEPGTHSAVQGYVVSVTPLNVGFVRPSRPVRPPGHDGPVPSYSPTS